MESIDAWKNLFESWPEAIPKKGLVVTKFDEMIPFSDFLISAHILMVERDKPDAHGSRKVMLGYDEISAVKLTSAEQLSRFQVMGFQAAF